MNYVLMVNALSLLMLSGALSVPLHVVASTGDPGRRATTIDVVTLPAISSAVFSLSLPASSVASVEERLRPLNNHNLLDTIGNTIGVADIVPARMRDVVAASSQKVLCPLRWLPASGGDASPLLENGSASATVHERSAPSNMNDAGATSLAGSTSAAVQMLPAPALCAAHPPRQCAPASVPRAVWELHMAWGEEPRSALGQGRRGGQCGPLGNKRDRVPARWSTQTASGARGERGAGGRRGAPACCNAAPPVPSGPILTPPPPLA